MKVAISEKRLFQIVKRRWMGQLMSVTYPDQQEEEEEAGPIKTWRVFGVYHLNQKDLSIDALPKCLIYRKSICTPISSALKKKTLFSGCKLSHCSDSSGSTSLGYLVPRGLDGSLVRRS